MAKSKYNVLTKEMEEFAADHNVTVEWQEEYEVFWLVLEDNATNKKARYLVGNQHAVQAMTFEYMLSVLQDLLEEVRGYVCK